MAWAVREHRKTPSFALPTPPKSCDTSQSGSHLRRAICEPCCGYPWPEQNDMRSGEGGRGRMQRLEVPYSYFAICRCFLFFFFCFNKKTSVGGGKCSINYMYLFKITIQVPLSVITCTLIFTVFQMGGFNSLYWQKRVRNHSKPYLKHTSSTTMCTNERQHVLCSLICIETVK